MSYSGFARVFFLFFSAFCVSAHATQSQLIADAHVSTNRSNVNFGSLSNLYVGNGNTAYLQFDLSSLPQGIKANQISRATITLFVNRVNTGGSVTLAPVTGTWSEYGITATSAPGTGAPVVTFPLPAAGQYISMDITSLVQGWITDSFTNFGVALSSAGANSSGQ